ncbi:MAG TPA: 1,4-alpha-glucan branching protein domain-containing protein [Solirubrobacteraceae bacterium]
MTEGRAAMVLHSHMPYVEGFGTWPFGEEWLWEAIATSYLPLLDLLDAGAPVTLSLTPVLCDQLEAPGAIERCRGFLREIRPAAHALDIEIADDPAVAAELQRAAGDYAAAVERLPADLLGALRPHAAWTSAATHAILPLLATDAGVRLQVRTGIESHRARFGDGWRGGFWLPECAHAPWLHALLEEAGVHATCVDLTDVLGHGDPRHLRPLATDAGPLLVPIDRVAIDPVWGADGYPSHGAYRDYHRRTARDHRPWANDGAVYDPDRAGEQAAADAADFVARLAARIGDGGLCVCALDTELLGHWWYEGPRWLAGVVDEARRRGVELVHLDDALADCDPAPAGALAEHVTSWGTPRDLSTWSGPQVAAMAWATRSAELDVLAAGPAIGERAVRELLALQSSDWAFLVTRDTAGPYPRERFDGHAAALHAALGDSAAEPALRHLAPHVTRAALLEP